MGSIDEEAVWWCSMSVTSSSSTWATVGLGAIVLAALVACPDQQSFDVYLREWLAAQITRRYYLTGTQARDASARRHVAHARIFVVGG